MDQKNPKRKRKISLINSKTIEKFGFISWRCMDKKEDKIIIRRIEEKFSLVNL